MFLQKNRGLVPPRTNSDQDRELSYYLQEQADEDFYRVRMVRERYGWEDEERLRSGKDTCESFDLSRLSGKAFVRNRPFIAQDEASSQGWMRILR